MAPVSINVRPSTGQVFKVQVDVESTTVFGLKEIIAASMGDVSPNDLKLVFSGRILKNQDNCSDYKIAEGNTVHVVRSGTNRAPAKQSQQQEQEPIPPIPATPSPANLPGLLNNTSDIMNPFSGGDGMGMPNMDPEVVRQMMDSPFMQSLLDNPDFIRSMVMNNPQIKAITEQNPEIGHLISDPSFLRQSMEMMRNPELMREMQRNNDRALSNIEAIPGGFNHLRRMYSTIQEPMESAISPAGSEEANERLARQLNVESVPEQSLNTQALPNPWSQQQANNSDHSSSSNTPRQQQQQQQTMSQNPFASLFGSSMPFGQQQQQQSPQSNNNNSSNQPPNVPFWADPNFIQATMRMQESLAGGQAQNNLFQQMMMGNNSIFGSQQQQTPTEPPEVRFRDQLAQLEEMGFSEKTANVRALLATGGNVEAAIEYLLSN
ncbi:hypothetical protein G6F43_002007 [Rhizopus delemar]|nr:hypothetical protein G6F43_002007 [Rhizopus delemar]